MKFEPKKSIGNLDFTGFSRVMANRHGHAPVTRGTIMGTEDAFASLKPFLELQRQMALTHGSATRTIEFRKPWDFEVKPYQYKQAEIEPLLTHPHASSLRWLDSMKLKVDVGLAEGSIAFEGNSVTVHCSEVRLDQTIELCTHNAKQQYICADFIALEEESEDAIQCPMFGYWM